MGQASSPQASQRSARARALPWLSNRPWVRAGSLALGATWVLHLVLILALGPAPNTLREFVLYPAMSVLALVLVPMVVWHRREPRLA